MYWEFVYIVWRGCCVGICDVRQDLGLRAWDGSIWALNALMGLEWTGTGPSGAIKNKSQPCRIRSGFHFSLFSSGILYILSKNLWFPSGIHRFEPRNFYFLCFPKEFYTVWAKTFDFLKEFIDLSPIILIFLCFPKEFYTCWAKAFHFLKEFRDLSPRIFNCPGFPKEFHTF